MSNYPVRYMRYERRGQRLVPVLVSCELRPSAPNEPKPIETFVARVTEVPWHTLPKPSNEGAPNDWISVVNHYPVSRFELIDKGVLQLARLYDGFSDAPYLELDDAACAAHDRDMGNSFGGLDNSRFLRPEPVTDVAVAIL